MDERVPLSSQRRKKTSSADIFSLIFKAQQKVLFFLTFKHYLQTSTVYDFHSYLVGFSLLGRQKHICTYKHLTAINHTSIHALVFFVISIFDFGQW